MDLQGQQPYRDVLTSALLCKHKFLLVLTWLGPDWYSWDQVRANPEGINKLLLDYEQVAKTLQHRFQLRLSPVPRLINSLLRWFLCTTHWRGNTSRWHVGSSRKRKAAALQPHSGMTPKDKVRDRPPLADIWTVRVHWDQGERWSVAWLYIDSQVISNGLAGRSRIWTLAGTSTFGRLLCTNLSGCVSRVETHQRPSPAEETLRIRWTKWLALWVSVRLLPQTHSLLFLCPRVIFSTLSPYLLIP